MTGPFLHAGRAHDECRYRAAKGLQLIVRKGRHEIDIAEMDDVVVHHDVPLRRIANVQVGFAIDGHENGKDRAEIVEKVGNADPLQRIEAPVVELEGGDRPEPVDRPARALQHALLESFDVDLDEIDAVERQRRRDVIEPTNRDRLRDVTHARGGLVGNEPARAIGGGER